MKEESQVRNADGYGWVVKSANTFIIKNECILLFRIVLYSMYSIFYLYYATIMISINVK
jgi:hypothetical protein